MKWLMELIAKKALDAADGAWQRGMAKENLPHTFGGLAGGGAIIGAITYLEQTLHCDLSLVKFAALWPTVQGWMATSPYFTFDQPSAGDDQHVKDGGGSV